jgi:hypothetical protein
MGDLKLLITLLSLLLCVTVAQGAEYYLSPTGSDEAAGDRARPWQTLAKANAAVQPGDTVTLLPGQYEGTIQPAASGQQGQPISYRSATPLGAVLRAVPGEGSSLCVRLKGQEHIRISGFDLRPAGGGWFLVEDCRSIVLSDMRLQEGRGSYTPALVRNSHYCRFERLDISRALQVSANGHVSGNMFGLYGSTHNVIEDCRFGQAGHCPFCIWPDSTHNVVRRCVFNARWGRNFELFTAPHTLMEACLITNTYHGSGSADGRAKLFIWEGIFRRNIVLRNWFQPLTIHAYKYGDMDPFGMVNSRLYHNTFYRNYESGFEMHDLGTKPEPHMVRGNVLQNNLFAENDYHGDGMQLNLGGSISRDNRFRANLLWGGQAGRPTLRYGGGWPAPVPERPESQLRTPNEANAALPEQFRDNRDGDPRFVNAARDDLRPGPGSAALNAGQPLAQATAAGNGRRLPVDDARWFYDGFGIPGEVGDLIMVGPTRQLARVRRAQVADKVLELDRPVKWAAGDPVTLPYLGSAPDIGAYEAGAEQQPWYVAPRAEPQLQIATLATSPRPLVVCGFEPENLEEWFYWWYTHRQRNTQAIMDATTAATGKRSLRIEATADQATLSCLLEPPDWDLDRAPTVRFSYRIPPGVPVGVCLFPFPTEKWGRGGVHVGGSPTHTPGGYKHLPKLTLQDDDQWHEATVDVRWIREVYPEVKFLRTFYFYTGGNGKQGQQFWFDDFIIEPASGVK